MSTTNPFTKTIDGVLNLYGTNAGNQIADLTTLGAVPSYVAQDYEGVKFAGPSSNYNFQQAGNQIVVTDKATGNIVSTVVTPVAGTQFQFSSGSPLTFTPTRTSTGYQINMGSTPISQYVAPTGGLSATGTTLTGAKDTVTPTGGLTATSTLTDPTKVTPMGGLSTTGATTVTPTGGATTGASTLVDAGKSTVTPTGGLSTTGTLTGGQPTTSSTATPATGTRDIGAMLSANALGDNNLTYDQLLTLLRNNNITIDQAAPFLGDAATRPEIVSALKNYQKLYDERYVNTYDPRTINTYALYQAEELAREGQRVDFSNQNRATQLEAWKRGYWTPADLKPIGTYGSNDIYLTSGITSANQGITGNPLVSTLQTALQNPGGMRENVGKAVRAYQDPTGKVIATPSQIAAADAYVKKLTGDPNATYVGTLRELDTYGGGGFMYDEQRLLGDVKRNLTSALEANLAISKWDPTTRGQMFAKRINELGVSPSFAAAALGVTERDIIELGGGDPTLWNKLAVNELIPTRPVVEGTSYRYGNAATVSGSNANTALRPTASQPVQTANTTATLPLSLTTFASGQVNLPNNFYSLPTHIQATALNNTKITAADLLRNGLDKTYVDSLIASGLKNQG